MKRALRIAIYLPFVVFMATLMTLVWPLYRLLLWLEDESPRDDDSVRALWVELIGMALR